MGQHCVGAPFSLPANPAATVGDDDDASTAGHDYPSPPRGPVASTASGVGGGLASSRASNSAFVDLDLSYLHPSQRPLTVVLQIDGIVVDYRNQMRAPRAVCLMFPLPYEDSNSIPDRAKVVRQGTVFDLRCEEHSCGVADTASALCRHCPPPLCSSLRSESRFAMTATLKTVVTKAALLENLHLLVKVRSEGP